MNHSGIQWYVKRDLSQIIETLKVLANTYHTAEFFKSNLYKRFIKSESTDDVNQVMAELTSLYVVRKDKDFKDLLEVDLHLSDENSVSSKQLQVKQSQPQKESKYISFLKVTKVAN